jgi:hypothetical protein
MKKEATDMKFKNKNTIIVVYMENDKWRMVLRLSLICGMTTDREATENINWESRALCNFRELPLHQKRPGRHADLSPPSSAEV